MSKPTLEWPGYLLAAVGITLFVWWAGISAKPPIDQVEYIAPEIPTVECISYDEAKSRYGDLALQFMVQTGGCG